MKYKKAKIKNIENNMITLSNGFKSYVYECSPIDCEQKSDKELQSYCSQIDNFLNSTSDSNKEFSHVKMYQLNGSFYINTISENMKQSPFDFKETNAIFEYFFGEFDPKKSIIINKDDYVKINGNYFRLLSFGSEITPETYLNHLSGVSDYVVFFKRKSKEEAKKKMNFTRKIFRASLTKSLRDIEGEGAFSEAEEFLESLTNGTQSYFTAEVFVIVKAKTEDDLQYLTINTIEYLKSIDTKMIIEAEGLTEIFPTLFFGIEPEYIRSFPANTAFLRNLLPLTNDFIHQDGSTFYTRSLVPVKVSLFNKLSKNYNALITGISGQGKSVLGQKLFCDEVNNGRGGVIFDLGKSFLRTAKILDATIFSEKFNPLQFRDAEYLQNFILSKIPSSEISEKIKGMLLRHIKEALSNDIQTFTGLLNELDKHIPDISFYFEDLLPYLSNENIDFNGIIYVDCTNYPASVVAPLTVFILECFKQMKGSKVILFDECWSFLRTIDDWIESQFRTMRKYEASAIAIAQNLDDLIGDDVEFKKVGRAIVQNTSHKFYLGQDISSDVLISEADKELIRSVDSLKGQYSEFLYMSESNRKICRYYQTTYEYFQFTTEKRDYVKIDSFIESLNEEEFSYKDKFDLFLESRGVKNEIN